MDPFSIYARGGGLGLWKGDRGRRGKGCSGVSATYSSLSQHIHITTPATLHCVPALGAREGALRPGPRAQSRLDAVAGCSFSQEIPQLVLCR